MYVLNRSDFRSFDTSRIVLFVECWERYYDTRRYEETEYFTQLNIGKDLTQENVTRLLQWKDPRMLTHPKKEDGSPNPRVIRVLEHVSELNSFRAGSLTSDEFQKVTNEIFPNGIIWQLFLFHVAGPAQWPIADQHVFRAYSLLHSTATPDSFTAYASYARMFHELVSVGEVREGFRPMFARAG